MNLLFHSEYIKKLDETFEKTKFKKLKSNPLNVDLAAYRKVINAIKPHLSNKDEYLLTPTESLKRGYGIPKNTKPNLPLRPIVSSLNSITNGGEKYLHKLIAPLVKKCKYSLTSTKEFKNKFSQIEIFDNNEFEIVCLDCVSLYTSVDLKLVLDYIIHEIYSNKELFFKDKTKTVKVGQIIKTENIIPPNKHQLKKLFNSVCTSFNSFETLNGFYRQTSGCSMGNKLSPSLANLFCNLFETKIVDNEIKNGNIKHYFRYVDDIFCLIRKNEKNAFFEKLNKFNDGLKFTMETMTNNKIVFLDTTVVNTNGKLHLEI